MEAQRAAAFNREEINDRYVEVVAVSIDDMKHATSIRSGWSSTSPRADDAHAAEARADIRGRLRMWGKGGGRLPSYRSSLRAVPPASSPRTDESLPYRVTYQLGGKEVARRQRGAKEVARVATTMAAIAQRHLLPVHNIHRTTRAENKGLRITCTSHPARRQWCRIQ